MISDYFRKVELRIRDAKVIADKNVDFREFSSLEGMLIGRLLFVDGSLLEFMEYLHGETRLKYRFHLMDKEGKMVFRYDDAPHHEIATFPHHKHLPGRVTESDEKSILDVLDEVEMQIFENSESHRKLRREF